MLANERLIVKMSLEQKLKLVTSLTMYESSSVGNYEFPVFKLKEHPYEDCPQVCATAFPSDKALASTWNTQLVSDVYNAIGEETRRVHCYGYFNNTDDYTLEGISNDNFLTSKYVLARIAGLSRSGQAVNFEKTVIEDGEHTYDKKFVTDAVLYDSKPTSILVRNAEDIAALSQKFKYSNLFFGVAYSAEETLRMLLNGCSLVFISEDFTPELMNMLIERTDGYRKAYKSYRDGDTPLVEFDRRVRNLEIFDEQIIDEACDRLLSLLLDMKSGSENIPEMNGLDENRKAKFDEISHDALALRAARQSVVLLKNDGMLPLQRHVNVAVVGGYASEFSYQKELFGFNPTVEMLPFDVINEYDGITPKGYAVGYAKGESGRQDLLHTAQELCTGADCALVYLCAGKGQTALPVEQIELIDSLYARGVSIIAVVACDGNINLSFADKCRAVLLTYVGGQEGTAAVLDILTGLVSPSGKLTEEMVRQNGEVMYPFGFGLSYTQFEYRSFKANALGVSFTVENTGDCDGFASVQLYVKKEDATNFFSNKTLRGFAKTFVKKGDSVNVEILFDDNTFKAYSDEKKCYVIEGGDYEVTVSENYDKDVLSGTITLAGHVYKTKYENEVVETATGGNIIFTDDKQKNEYARARKKLSFGVKLFLAIVLGVYYNAVIAVFAFSPIISDKGPVLYGILGGLALVFDALLIVYIVLIAKQRKKQLYLDENEVLTDMVEKIEEFKEVAKVTYAEPVKEEDDETREEEEDAGLPDNPFLTTKNEEEEERDFDNSLDESTEDVVFTEHISLAEVCSNFRDFALSFGVNVEMTSVRSLVAAMAASKIVILKSANVEVLPLLLDALGAYYGAPITETFADWENAGELLWKIEDTKYVVSDFTNAVYAAVKSPEKRCAAILRDISAENINKYFSDFINYANHPSEEHNLALSEELSVKLPDNITYFLTVAEGDSKPLPKELINGATVVELALSAAVKGAETEVKNVAYSEFCDLVKAARDEFFISEKYWKKTDELYEAINATEKFNIGNKNTLQAERLSSVIMECGGDEAEALVQIFVCKIVPLLKYTRTYKQDGGERTLYGIIEKLYPEENLAKVQKSLLK